MKSIKLKKTQKVSQQVDAYVKCWLCSGKVPVRIDKNGRPYLYCSYCQMQTFIHSDEGISVLKTKLIKL